MERDWSYPLLVLLARAGGCMERGVVAALLWVRPSTVRRMAWSLSRRGLVRLEGQRLCITLQGLQRIGWVELLAHKRNHYLAYGRGVAVLVSYRNRGASVYVAGREALCRVLHASSGLGRSSAAVREAASKTGLASKTVSYAIRILRLMGCPGSGCGLDCGDKQ